MARKPGRMASLGDKARDETNRELSDTEANILLSTTTDWKALRPKVADQETFDKLIEQVQQATANNEDIAQLKTRIENLGKEGWALAKKVIELIP